MPAQSIEADVRRLLDAFDTVPVAAFEFDRELKLVRFNDAGAAILGPRAEEAIGVTLGRYNPWLREGAEDAIRSGRARARFDTYRSHLSGETKRGIVTYLPDLDDAGRVRRLFIEAIDVTGLTEEGTGGIERSQFEAIFQQMLGGIMVVGAPDATLLYLNERGRRLIGMEIGHPVSASLSSTCVGEPSMEVEFPVVRALRGEVVRGEEVIVCAEGGPPVDVLASAAPIFDAEGRITAAFGLLVDMKSRRHADEARRRAEEAMRRRAEAYARGVEAEVVDRVEAEVAHERVLLASVLENAEIGIAITDAEGSLLRTNVVLERFLGYDEAELLGMPYERLVYVDDLPREFHALSDLAEGRVAGYTLELRFVRKDGRVAWARTRTTLAPERRPSGAEIIRLVEDLTEERHAAEELVDRERSVRRAYAEVIAAMTGDRLVILPAAELLERLGDPLYGPVRVTAPQELGPMRKRLQAWLDDALPRLPDPEAFVLATSEAVTNAVKHAGGGSLEVRRTGDRLQGVVRDRGPGIDFGELPRATLEAGYSTLAASLGVGFTIMLETCDSVLFSTGPDGTVVVLQVSSRARS